MRQRRLFSPPAAWGRWDAMVSGRVCLFIFFMLLGLAAVYTKTILVARKVVWGGGLFSLRWFSLSRSLPPPPPLTSAHRRSWLGGTKSFPLPASVGAPCLRGNCTPGQRVHLACCSTLALVCDLMSSATLSLPSLGSALAPSGPPPDLTPKAAHHPSLLGPERWAGGVREREGERDAFYMRNDITPPSPCTTFHKPTAGFAAVQKKKRRFRKLAVTLPPCCLPCPVFFPRRVLLPQRSTSV